ncbi:MAG: glycosyltransferase family 92 protein [Planctomycetaceae bacterium]|nr:glycosyltransferase family 92 protein [Planctomycetaceae bacterium]
MYNLSVAAMFRNENSWLEEWIRYHKTVGVEHFYLFNDDPDTCVSDKILEPYLKQGLVENIHVSELTGLDTLSGNDWVKRIYGVMFETASGNTRWLAMTDLDEFILPKKQDDLRELLAGYEEHCGLAMNWQIFGTNGYVKRPPTQTCHLLHRAETHWQPNRFFKSIVKPDLVIHEMIYDSHHFPCTTGRTVNENHEPVAGVTHEISTEIIQLNHYTLRSWQDFWEVKATRPRYNGAAPCDEQYFDFHDRNEVFDDEIKKRFGNLVNNP